MFNYQQKPCAFLCYRYTFSMVGMKHVFIYYRWCFIIIIIK